jgi:hypothetical protein
MTKRVSCKRAGFEILTPVINKSRVVRFNTNDVSEENFASILRVE